MLYREVSEKLAAYRRDIAALRERMRKLQSEVEPRQHRTPHRIGKRGEDAVEHRFRRPFRGIERFDRCHVRQHTQQSC